MVTKQVGEYRRAVSVDPGPAVPVQPGHHMGPPVAPRLRCGPHLMGEIGHKPQSARHNHHIGAAEGPHRPAAAPHVMAVGGKCLVAGGVCEPFNTLGGDGLCVTPRCRLRSVLLSTIPSGWPGPGARDGPDAVQPGRGEAHSAVGDRRSTPTNPKGPVNCTGNLDPAARGSIQPALDERPELRLGNRALRAGPLLPRRGSVAGWECSWRRHLRHPRRVVHVHFGHFQTPGILPQPSARRQARPSGHRPYPRRHRSTSTGVARSTTRIEGEPSLPPRQGRLATLGGRACPTRKQGTRSSSHRTGISEYWTRLPYAKIASVVVFPAQVSAEKC